MRIELTGVVEYNVGSGLIQCELTDEPDTDWVSYFKRPGNPMGIALEEFTLLGKYVRFQLDRDDQAGCYMQSLRSYIGQANQRHRDVVVPKRQEAEARIQKKLQAVEKAIKDTAPKPPE